MRGTPHVERAEAGTAEGSAAPGTGLPRVVVCIASHERNGPLQIVLRNLPADWHAVVVVTTREDQRAITGQPGEHRGRRVPAVRPNTHVFRHVNTPLGAKWQYAVDQARKLNPDLLLITGSDDVILGDTVQLMEAVQGHDMLCLSSFTIYDGVQHYRCGYVRTEVPIGGGRVYTRELLERMRWKLFDPARNRGLDDFGYHHARRNGARIHLADEHPGYRVIALKGPWKMYNTMERLREATHKIRLVPLPELRPVGDYQF